ncbi:MAG: hypothetical protein ABFR63_00125 [Thermodesulfobacteriota bacterium]
MQENAVAKERNRTETSVHDVTHTDSELYKVGKYFTAAVAAAVGVWGLLCLSSAMLNNGGPVEMTKSLFIAITGA